MEDCWRRLRETLLLGLLVASGLLLFSELAAFGIALSSSAGPGGAAWPAESIGQSWCWALMILLVSVWCLRPPTAKASRLVIVAAVITGLRAGAALVHWGIQVSDRLGLDMLPVMLGGLVEVLVGVGCAILLWRLTAMVRRARASQLVAAGAPPATSGGQPTWDPQQAVGRQWARAADAAAAAPRAASADGAVGEDPPGRTPESTGSGGLAPQAARDGEDTDRSMGPISGAAELPPAPPVRRTTWSRGGMAPGAQEPTLGPAGGVSGMAGGPSGVETVPQPWTTAAQAADGRPAAPGTSMAGADRTASRPAPDWRPAQRTT